MFIRRIRSQVIALAGAVALVALVVATCAPNPVPTGVPHTPDATSSAGATSSATVSPTTASPTTSATTDAGCVVAPQSGLLRLNTLLDMTADSDGASDRVTFTFGPIAPGPTGGMGRLTAATPPFSQGGSGLPVEVLGTHHVMLHLDGMLIVDANGKEVYAGPTSLKPGMIALKAIEETDGFEGVYNFVIGYDGNGCVGLTGDSAAGSLTVTIGH